MTLTFYLHDHYFSSRTGPPVFSVMVEVFKADIVLLPQLDAILSSKGFSGCDRGFVSTLPTLMLTWSAHAPERCWSRCLTFTHSPQALHFVSCSAMKSRSSDDGGVADSGTSG